MCVTICVIRQRNLPIRAEWSGFVTHSWLNYKYCLSLFISLFILLIIYTEYKKSYLIISCFRHFISCAGDKKEWKDLLTKDDEWCELEYDFLQ
jgi:hypothetical protein